MNKILKGDEVIVLAGKDKGKRGKVMSREGDRLVVDGVNMVKKHTKPNPMKNEQGGVVAKAASIHQSNIAIFNPASGKADKVGIKTSEDGKTRVRIYKSDGQTIAHTWSKA